MRTEVAVGRTPAGRRIEVSGRVLASPDRAWDLLVDTGRWAEWGPSVSAVDCADRRIREGSTGRVRIPGGAWIPFEITEFDPGRRRWDWRVAKIPATGHRVDPIDGREDMCRVVFEIPILAVGYVPVCRRAVGRIADLLTAG